VHQMCFRNTTSQVPDGEYKLPCWTDGLRTFVSPVDLTDFHPPRHPISNLADASGRPSHPLLPDCRTTAVVLSALILCSRQLHIICCASAISWASRLPCPSTPSMNMSVSRDCRDNGRNLHRLLDVSWIMACRYSGSSSPFISGYDYTLPSQAAQYSSATIVDWFDFMLR
jgi:hypothetical protein